MLLPGSVGATIGLASAAGSGFFSSAAGAGSGALAAGSGAAGLGAGAGSGFFSSTFGAGAAGFGAASFFSASGAGAGFGAGALAGAGFGATIMKYELGGSSDRDTLFSFQFLAGAGYRMTENLSLILGYRYFRTLDSKFDVGGRTVSVERQAIHGFETGVRFDF